MADRVERRFFEFGCFRLDPAGRVLFRGDQVIPLPPKAADTLLLLVQNAGNVVEKQDLLKNVWQDAFVEEGSTLELAGRPQAELLRIERPRSRQVLHRQRRRRDRRIQRVHRTILEPTSIVS